MINRNIAFIRGLAGLMPILVLGCSSIKLENDLPYNLSIQFIGAQNDLTPSMSGLPSSTINYKGIVDDGGHTITFPLTSAVSCNQAKTECKHGVIKTSLKFEVQGDKSDKLQLVGVLHSEIGRSMSISNSLTSTSSMIVTERIPKTIPVMPEQKLEKPFNKALILGEYAEIEGMENIRVSVKLK